MPTLDGYNVVRAGKCLLSLATVSMIWFEPVPLHLNLAEEQHGVVYRHHL